MLATTLPVIHHHIPEHSNLQQHCCDENQKYCMFCALFLSITPPVPYPLLIAAPVISSLVPVLPTVLKLKDILHKWSLVIGLYLCLHFGKLSCNISTSSPFSELSACNSLTVVVCSDFDITLSLTIIDKHQHMHFFTFKTVLV